MGSDFADINNDLKPDLIVVDMLSEDRIRGKENMATMNTNSFNMMVNAGYHHQYMSNMLQLNNGNGAFSEIGQLAGISNTDWSWAPLIADFDNDGFNDLFVTNGIKHDLSNQDFREQMRKNIMNRKRVKIEDAIGMMPSEKLQNYFYKNNGDLTFKKVSNLWGITEKINSNGVAYADLDNDGDLDLVINNMSELASIYQNNSKNNYVKITLNGTKNNLNAIGAKVEVYTKENQHQKTVFVSRGYQSSVSHNLIFGLEKTTKIDSLKVIWNDKKEEIITNVTVNTSIALDYKNSSERKKITPKSKSIFEIVNAKEIGIDYKHKAVKFNDFAVQTLLPQKQSTIDNAIAVADVNNDGLDDLFIGNTQGNSAKLYVLNAQGKFITTNQNTFE
jgi:hypothetical protein